MKKLSFLSLFTFLLLIINCGKGDRPVEKTKAQIKYVTAKGGLNMREKHETSGALIVNIPEGEGVQIFEETGSDMTISGSTGKWTKVNWKEKIGWAFGGFLSKEQKTVEGPSLPDFMIGDYEYTGIIEPGNMPSRIHIYKGIITKAIGGYVRSGKFCIINTIEKQGDGFIVKCSDRNPTVDEIEKFDLEQNASKLTQVIIITGVGTFQVDNEPYKKR